MSPELSRIVKADRLPASLHIVATAEECAALAARLKIPLVESLTCRFTLRRHGDSVSAEGTLRANVVQSCVVSLEDVPQAIDEVFAIRFVPAGQERDDDDPDAPDELSYTGTQIDLGEATAEQLALALDPYPRHPDAVFDQAALDEGDFPAIVIPSPDRSSH